MKGGFHDLKIKTNTSKFNLVTVQGDNDTSCLTYLMVKDLCDPSHVFVKLEDRRKIRDLLRYPYVPSMKQK